MESLLHHVNFHCSKWTLAVVPDLGSCGTQAQLPWGMWDLSFPPRDRTRAPCIARWTLNHRTREMPHLSSFSFPHPFLFFLSFKGTHLSQDWESSAVESPKHYHIGITLLNFDRVLHAHSFPWSGVGPEDLCFYAVPQWFLLLWGHSESH